jgi:hypothetical protein
MAIKEGTVPRGAGLEGGSGSTFYVNGATGSDSDNGRGWSSAFVTIQAAINACTSGAGDRIYVAPATYAENLSVSQKDYVSIIGVLEPGYARPDIVKATGLMLNVDRSHGVVLRHLRFAADGQDSDVVRNEGNGFVFDDCVFDGAAGMAATKALVRLWCDAADDSYTASEGLIKRCLFRGSPGYGLAADVQNAAVGVGPTHNVMEDCRFISNTAEDLIALETAAGTYSMQDWLVARSYFGMGTAKNKATHIDISTNNGATNTGNVFAGCFINDDTVNTTAIKAVGTGSSFIGCYSLDGLIDGDALD